MYCIKPQTYVIVPRLSLTKGFTLLELMVTVAMIAVLAAIAIPSYQQQIRRNHEQKVKSLLLMQANDLDRWRARQLNYAGFAPPNIALDTTDSMSFDYPVVYNDTPASALAPSASGIWYTIQLATITGGANPVAVSLSNPSPQVATNWVLLARPQRTGMPIIGMTSRGVRCQSLDGTLTAETLFTDGNCGARSESW